MMKRGLVMEGGGMRGLFTAGVTDVFLENKIVFEGAIGTSAGAVFGDGTQRRIPAYTVKIPPKCAQAYFCPIRSHPARRHIHLGSP